MYVLALLFVFVPNESAQTVCFFLTLLERKSSKCWRVVTVPSFSDVVVSPYKNFIDSLQRSDKILAFLSLLNKL